MKKIAILGAGTVGGSCAQILLRDAAVLEKNAGEALELAYVVDLRDMPDAPFHDKMVKDFAVVEADPEVFLVIEAIGGCGAALNFVRRSLEAGKHVVTSNKQLVAEHGTQLLALAKAHGVSFLFEASVGGGIPVLHPLSQCLGANEILEVRGILNGTTNFILTQMLEFGQSYDAALKDAQARGYAEQNPAADVDGIDAGRKICILADMMFGKNVDPARVSMTGISTITAEDAAFAESAGMKLKLLGRAIRQGEQIAVFVSPHFVAGAQPLAPVSGVLNAIEVLGKRQKVIAGVCADTDVWGLYTGAAKSGCAVVHVEDGSVTGRETSIFTAPTDETEADTLSALLSQYYLPRGVLPREILLPFAVDELSGLETVLTSRAGHRVTLRVPQRGEKAELLAMAERNAREEVERVTTAAEREDKTLRSLAAMCGLSAAPKRMESYDISNTGASDIVASMVVYAGARPLKRDYRRFKMKSVTEHPDDYASMEEVLTRRLQRYADGDEKFAPLPDVFLIDGGMTHAAVAEKVCAVFGLHIPIFGMVKDDRHRTRALTTAEGHEIDLHADPAVFALIGQIQEETHRFAITYHHESHTRSSVASALDGIPNIGEVRKRKLLARFKSVKAIREAELPALQSELGRAAGRAVYDHFHPKEETP